MGGRCTARVDGCEVIAGEGGECGAGSTGWQSNGRSGVPVFTPGGAQAPRATVTVSGLPGVLNALKSEDLKIILMPDGSFNLARELEGKVTLKSTKFGPER